MSGKRVFITGIAGFLGSHIADRCLAEGYRVSGCDNLTGGYLDNVPGGGVFHQIDCNDFASLAVMIDWIKSRELSPFLHNVELKIDGPLAPKTWSKKILCKEAVGLYMNLLRNRLIGPYFRSFSTNSYGYSLSNDQKSVLEQPISRNDP